MDAPPETATRPTDPDAWVSLHADHLFRYARSRLAGEHEAHDVVQETLIAGWRHREADPDGRPPGAAWLKSVLRNKLADHYRRVYRERGAGRADLELTPGEYDRAGHWDDARAPKPWKEPAENDERGRIELREVLAMCLEKLPVSHARVFIMREAEAIDTAAIREITGITESNLFVMLHRARNALRRCLEENHFGTEKLSS